MLKPYGQQVHEIYRTFAEQFIIKGNSLFSSDLDILNEDNITQCHDRYILNYLDGNKSFEEKIADQFSGANQGTWGVFAHAIWLWSYAAGDIDVQTKRARMEQIFQKIDQPGANELFCWGFGFAGTYHKTNKYNEIRFNLILIKFLRDKVVLGEITSVESVLDWTEKICLYQKYEQEDPAFFIKDEIKELIQGNAVAMCNILCFAAKPDHYERIASDDHKWQILNSFSGLLDTEEAESESINIDDKIAIIRKKIATIIKNPEFDFYDEDDIALVWNYALEEEGAEVIQALKYKKAIILYGPPGTSKTFSAMNLAHALIRTQYLKIRKNVELFLNDDIDFSDGRIHHLQMHTNYNYEDFIIGVHLENHNMKTRPGKLFDICDMALKDKDMPHVLILDEINRVDLSRLFGEAFSALENREIPVEVSLDSRKLCIPKNLYIIGTMNEIDFSLERMDFALRRRFLWFEYGFSPTTLRLIIDKKEKNNLKKISENEISKFINNAVRLNKSIISLPDLGKQYQIGHTFFAEIVDIVSQYRELKGLNNKLKNTIYRDWGPSDILWKISIKPMIEAFLGNIDKQSKDAIIENLWADYNHG